MKRKVINVKPASVQILMGGLALLILINLLARFGWVNFTSYQTNIFTIVGALFLMAEVSAFSMIKKRKRKGNALDLVIGIIALLAIILSVTSLTGIVIPYLSSIQNIIDLSLIVFVFVEIFRKNK